MTSEPVKYFEHYLGGRSSLAVHRLDELVQISFNRDHLDLPPDVVFFAPTAAHALVEAIDAAAREAQAFFDAANSPTHRPPPPQRAELPPAGLPEWGPQFTYGGLPYVLCPAGDGRVGPGQSAVPETSTGRIWHDDCAEDAAAGRQSLTCPDPLTPASASPVACSTSALMGDAHGAAGADRASAVPCRPAAPSPSPAQ